MSASPRPIYDPATGDAANNRTAFADNTIPTNRISPIAQKSNWRTWIGYCKEPGVSDL